LNDVGLSYLTLNRSANTLAGGEAQRIRLATQIGSSLMGVLYILDEPSIGLHQRDNDRLIETLKRLKSLGNTVIVVDHDEDTIRASDYVIDIGPAAGVHGGEVVAAGTPDEVARVKESITGQYLSGARKIPVPKKRRPGNGKSLKIIGAVEHNLKNIDVAIPLGNMTVVSGVSGSGKSSLIIDIVMARTEPAGKHSRILEENLIRSSTLIRVQLAEHRAQIQPPTLVRSLTFVTSLRRYLRQRFVATLRVDLALTSKAVAVRPVRAMGSLRLRCTFCQMYM
jgi:excinuclease ABC subunit A